MEIRDGEVGHAGKHGKDKDYGGWNKSGSAEKNWKGSLFNDLIRPFPCAPPYKGIIPNPKKVFILPILCFWKVFPQIL